MRGRNWMRTGALCLLAGCGSSESIGTLNPFGRAPQSPAEQSDAVTVLPEIAADRDWRMRYSPDVTYVNVSGTAQPVLSEPSGTVTTGTIAPSEGGRIQTCAADAAWCRIEYGPRGEVGWVDMRNMGGMAT